MRDLKFCGAMINGHTHGQYLDHASLYPFWERAEALGALIYIHPTDPVTPPPVLEGLQGPAPRHLGMGIRDRLARVAPDIRRTVRPLSARQLELGHLGETLPFLLWRFDSRGQIFMASSSANRRRTISRTISW